MGYTHYFTQTTTIPTDTIKMIKKEARKLLRTDMAKAETRYEGDSNAPALIQNGTKGIIRFNGIGGDAHETFYLDLAETTGMFDFCKTAMKPYDKYVCSILISLAFLAPSCFDLESDGSLREPEWQDAIDYYSRTLGKDREEVESVVAHFIMGEVLN